MRTSWKVGLATAAAEPTPRAMPRTKVVLPAPSSPFRRTRSPLRRRRPSSSPAASVSSAADVSREVVVATSPQLDKHPVRADHLHNRLFSQLSDRMQAEPPDQVFGAGADQLDLLPTRERVRQGRPGGQRDIGAADDGAGAREGGELLHLPQQAVGDVAAAQPGLVQKLPFLQKRPQPERTPLTKRDRRR